MLYRVFPYAPGTPPRPLQVPRAAQGGGRHDNPDWYAALYLARDPVAAIAERVQAFRGQELDDDDFRRTGGSVLTLAEFTDRGLDLVDLDDPAVLVRDGLRPSQVASTERTATQRIALRYFQMGAAGLSWWSTLRADWTNVTLFDVRIPRGTLEAGTLTALSVTEPLVLDAAAIMGIRLATRRPRRGREAAAG